MHAHHIDSPYAPGIFAQFVQIGYEGLLMGDGHVEAPQVFQGTQVVHGLFNVFELKIVIACGDVLTLELFGKIAGREAVTQGVAQQAVLFWLHKGGLSGWITATGSFF